jgi:SAM-dependent methyltransferase
MRITYRTHDGNKAYWHQRWNQIPSDEGGLNFDRYPGKYADWVINKSDGPILEAGCGAGRVLIHYHRHGKPIIGMDFIAIALSKMKGVEPDMPMVAGDVRNLPFSDKSFGIVLAFGLYHNLENGFVESLTETKRTLRSGGYLCASMRADNWQNRITDWLANRGKFQQQKTFHKINYTPQEIRTAFANSGFEIEKFEYVENMPFLYKFKIFRHRTHKIFDETRARAEGYRLSAFGQFLQSLLVTVSPASFCNIFVVTACSND